MGCDIHPAIEYLERGEPESWDCFGQLHFDRNYALFTILAGVRDHYGYVSPEYKRPKPKGLPKNLSYWIDSSEDLGDHSFSWFTLSELKKCLDAYEKYVSWPGAVEPVKAPPELIAAVAAMESLEASGLKTRLIFGFDS